jgi:hypothetical protein
MKRGICMLTIQVQQGEPTYHPALSSVQINFVAENYEREVFWI